MTSTAEKDIQFLTGSELLTRIREEKEKMKKEGEIKNQPRLSPISNEEKPYNLPHDWEWVRLGDISSIIMGQSPKGETVHEVNNGDIEFHQGKTNFGKRYLFPSGKFASVPKKVSPANSILISMRAPVGTLNITDRPVAIGRGLASIRPIGGVSLLFLYHVMSAFESDLKKFATGSTFEAITGEVLSNLILPLPPLFLQQMIVKKLEKAEESQNKISELSEIKMNETNKYRQSILQEAMRGGLVEQNAEEGTGQELLTLIQLERKQEGKRQKKQELQPVEVGEEPYKLPENWVWTRLGELYSLSSGKALEKKESNGEFLVYGANGITGNSSKYLFDEQKILIARVGASVGSMNISEPKSWVTDNAFVASFNEKALNFYWSFYVLGSIDFFSLAKATAQPVISYSKVKDVLVPLPPLAEQQRIVQKLEAIIALCDRLEEELKTTKAESAKWYRAVLQEAFQPEVE